MQTRAEERMAVSTVKHCSLKDFPTPTPASTYRTHQNPLTKANKRSNAAEIQESAFHTEGTASHFPLRENGTSEETG